jgi:hypothetical protein
LRPPARGLVVGDAALRFLGHRQDVRFGAAAGVDTHMTKGTPAARR